MDIRRFNDLLNGPLNHPFPMFALQRVIMALYVVLEATGETGSQALERHCAELQARDESAEGSDGA